MQTIAADPLGDNVGMSASGEASPYDSIASLYDRWNSSVVEDIGFYTEEAALSGGPVLELGVGTGRIAFRSPRPVSP